MSWVGKKMMVEAGAPWLREMAVARLRDEHIARWAFNVGDVVVWRNCWDGGDHHGIITKLHREPGRVYAHVRLVCKEAQDVEVGTLFLVRALPPFPKEVLDLRHRLRVEGE